MQVTRGLDPSRESRLAPRGGSRAPGISGLDGAALRRRRPRALQDGARSWKRGQIVKLHYGRRVGRRAKSSYQIHLDAGVLIFAPEDSDCLIQADDGMEEDADCGAEVHVCQAGPCRRAGGEPVLLEIEELANSVGG